MCSGSGLALQMPSREPRGLYSTTVLVRGRSKRCGEVGGNFIATSASGTPPSRGMQKQAPTPRHACTFVSLSRHCADGRSSLLTSAAKHCCRFGLHLHRESERFVTLYGALSGDASFRRTDCTGRVSVQTDRATDVGWTLDPCLSGYVGGHCLHRDPADPIWLSLRNDWRTVAAAPRPHRA